MRKRWVRLVPVLIPAIVAPALGVGPTNAAVPPPTSVDRPAEQTPDRSAVPPERRSAVFGAGWRTSADRAWATAGNSAGLHILVAEAAQGYAWRTAATLSEPGFNTDRWIGNACLTGDAARLVVAYAPRAFTNRAELFDRGAFTAVVDLATGKVTKLPVTGSLAYFTPACGAGSEALITQARAEGVTATRLVPVNAAEARVGDPIEVPGQLTSAVPTGNGIVAADAGVLVRVAPDGRRTAIARTDGVPFRLTADRDGGVVFLDRRGGTAAVRRVGATAVSARAGSVAPAALLADGPLDRIGLARDAAGTVHLTGEATLRRSLPATVRRPGVPKGAVMSSRGEVAVTEVAPASSPAAAAHADPADPDRPVTLRLAVPATGASPASTVKPSGATDPAGRLPHPALAALAPSEPVEDERYCSVPRNDPRNQAMQPKPRQVEWAVDQAVTGSLTLSRPANWKNLGMAGYSPQRFFPPIPLLGGGRVPAQVFLGILAQESNLWQAPGAVVPGVTGNPLIGNYYGLEVYNEVDTDDWDIRWAEADCGYGVAQVTDGMRRAGRERPGETALPYHVQRAVALDFAANIAAGLRILQEKWNETRGSGLIVNDGDPARIENWFFAAWAYNSGFHHLGEPGSNGAWGVGWANNPVNPKYPADRPPFLEDSYTDATHPQDWPYPEKVIGWAGHPVEVLEGPGALVAGFRPAWWPGRTAAEGAQHRREAKPPVALFCDATNDCVPGGRFVPNDPDVADEPAGPCAHRNADGWYDLRCWYHKPAMWKPDCPLTCGYELLRFDPGYAYQEDATSYPPNCGLAGLPAGALIVDDVPDAVPSVRPGCSRPFTNAGTFRLDFASDGKGFPSKIDFHQLGAGFGGHFWYGHTRQAALRGNSMRVTGTWQLGRALQQWARVLVHLPDHGAHTQQAHYQVELGDGTVKTRVMLQRTMANRWVSLGVFRFAGTPRVRLSTVTHDGDDASPPHDNEDIAFDAVAWQPLPGKPAHIVAALGDSYAAGEGGSGPGGVDYYRESDNNGDDPRYRNACHRSRHTWSRLARFAGTSGSIGALSDSWNRDVEHNFIACSGAQTENLLPLHSASGTPPRNDFGEPNTGQYGELTQLDRGFLDEHTTLVTLSVGGNDARFGQIVAECVIVGGPIDCSRARLPGSAEPAGEEVPRLIAGPVENSVHTVLREIGRAAPNARILLMGYPRLVDGPCLPGVAHDERLWLNQMADLLNQHLAEAAERANTAAGRRHVWFADPRDAFAGRAVCGSPETVHGIVAPEHKTPGEIPGSDPPTSAQSFHPKITGYQTYAEVMNVTLRDMGL